MGSPLAGALMFAWIVIVLSGAALYRRRKGRQLNRTITYDEVEEKIYMGE